MCLNFNVDISRNVHKLMCRPNKQRNRKTIANQEISVRKLLCIKSPEMETKRNENKKKIMTIEKKEIRIRVSKIKEEVGMRASERVRRVRKR